MNELIRAIRARVPGCAVSIGVQQNSSGDGAMTTVSVFPMPAGTPEVRDRDDYDSSPSWYTLGDSERDVHLVVTRFRDDDAERALRDVLTVLDELEVPSP